MKIDTSLLVSNLSEIPAVTCHAEELGFNRIWTAETAHDPFLPLILAAVHSQRLTLGISIALTFPRSPAILAYLAYDPIFQRTFHFGVRSPDQQPLSIIQRP